MAKRGKKYQQAATLVNSEGEYTLQEACDLVKKTTITSFDASVDIDIRLGIDPSARRSDGTWNSEFTSWNR